MNDYFTVGNFIVRNEGEVRAQPPLSSKKKQKPTRLDCLTPGDRFEVVGLEDMYRNLYLVSISECSCLVRGDVRWISDEPFTKLSPGYGMALATTVRRI